MMLVVQRLILSWRAEHHASATRSLVRDAHSASEGTSRSVASYRPDCCPHAWSSQYLAPTVDITLTFVLTIHPSATKKVHARTASDTVLHAHWTEDRTYPEKMQNLEDHQEPRPRRAVCLRAPRKIYLGFQQPVAIVIVVVQVHGDSPSSG